MKVYVVVEFDTGYDDPPDECVKGVYSSLEAAKQSVPAEDKWSVDKTSWLSYLEAFVWIGNKLYTIREFRLDNKEFSDAG